MLVACGGAPRGGVTRAEPPCTADANLVLAGQEDVFAAAGCSTIQSLTVRTGAPIDLSALAKLHVILGDLRIGPTVGVDEVRLPELRSAGAITIAANHDLHGVFLPKLATARSISVESNVALRALSLPSLTTVGDALTVRGNGDLELVEASSLQTVGGALVVANHPDLALLELGKLERAQSVTLENNGALDANIVDAIRSKAAP